MIKVDKNSLFLKLNEYAKDVKIETSNNSDENIPEWSQNRYYIHDDQTLILHKEIIDFANYSTLTEKEIYIRKLIILRFQNIVQSIWPEAIVICIGSFSQGTSLPDADLDLSIQNVPKDRDTDSLLFELHERMDKLNFFTKSRVLTTSYIHIIKCVESPFQIKLDISINNDVAIVKIIRFKNQVEMYPSLFPVLVFIKYLIDYKKLNLPYHGGINNFMLCVMIINVIQSIPENDQLNCGKVLLRFLDVFANKFNYFLVGLTIRNGGSLFNRIKENAIKWNIPFSLSIEDDFNPGYYLGRRSCRITEIRNIFKSAYEQLISDLKPNEKSILSRIVSLINPNVLEKRQNTVKLYDTLIENTK